jgi:hypothetical protein
MSMRWFRYFATYPLNPPPLQGRGKVFLRRGASASLKHPARLFSPLWGWGMKVLEAELIRVGGYGKIKNR